MVGHDLDGLQVGHDDRQVPEIPPERVDLVRLLVQRNLALELHAELAHLLVA
jgi:hypothetical protein